MDNLEITSVDGKISTNDNLLNRIIRQAEREIGSPLAMAIPAITFDDDPDKKFYLILLRFYDDDVKDWSIRQGRQNVYDYLRFLISEEQIDPNESFIIGCDTVTNTAGKDDVKFATAPITVFRFMKVMLEEGKILDDRAGFDIDEFDPCNADGDNTIVEV